MPSITTEPLGFTAFSPAYALIRLSAFGGSPSCTSCSGLPIPGRRDSRKNKAGNMPALSCRRTFLWYALTLVQCPGHLRRLGGERVHQRRTQAVVRLQAELLDPAAHFAHLARIETRLDDRRHECRELRFLPAGLRRQFGVDEVQAVERVLVVLYAAIQVYAAAGTGMALDRRVGVDDLQFVAVLGDADLVTRNNRDDRKIGALGLPALGAAAGMIVRGLRTNADFDGIRRALADQCSARKILVARLDAVVYRWM